MPVFESTGTDSEPDLPVVKKKSRDLSMNKKTNPILTRLALTILASGLYAAQEAQAQPTACSVSSDNLTTTCSGGTITQTTPTPNTIGQSGNAINVYDASAGQYPLANGSNSYTPTHWLTNPPTVTVNILSGTTFNFTNPTTAQLADKGVIGANFSNTESYKGEGVNNWILNNAGTIGLSTNAISARLQTVISDSQVNLFTLSNTGTITSAQTYFASGFNASLLTNTYSSSSLTDSAKYNSASLNPISTVYTDDNTNGLSLTNSGSITTSGNFAAAIYGRAGQQEITNSGLLGNTDWSSSDLFYTGHWAIVNYGGATFSTVAGSNPDSPLYNVVSNGSQNTVAVLQDSQTSIVNSGTIKGDIVMIDSSPLTMAAALANGQALPVPNSGTNSGPRDSYTINSGTINGNFYLGSGAHAIDNSGTINGNINVDQSASLGAFAVGVAGNVPGTWSSAGPGTTSANTGLPCAAAGANTTDASCAATTTKQAYFAGSRIFYLSDSGAMNGNVVITNTTAESQITIQASSAAGVMTPGIQGTLSITGAVPASNVVIQPGLGTDQIVHSNNVFDIARSVGGNLSNSTYLSEVVSNSATALVNWNASFNNAGNLLYTASVANAYSLPGITASGANAINALMGYNGSNGTVGQLGNQVQALTSASAAAQMGNQLTPNVNNTNYETIFNITNNLERIIDNHMTEGHMAGYMGADYNPVNHNSTVAKEYGVTPGVWVEGTLMSQNQGTYQGASGYTGTLHGFAIGLDTRLGENDEWLAGGMFATTQGTMNQQADLANNSNKLGSNQGFLYGSWRPSNFYLNSMVGFGGTGINTYRFINANNQGMNGNTSAMQYSGRIDTGYLFDSDFGTLIPVGYFGYTRVNQGGYTESGGTGALQVNSGFMNSERLGLGGKAVLPIYEGKALGLSDFLQGQLELSALWSHEFGNVNNYTSASYVADPTASFTVVGLGPARNSGLLGAGARLTYARFDDIKPSVLFNYFCEVKDQYTSQTGMIQGRIDF
jgi:uncharacterized protein with beta-barrel porin domain